MNYFAKFQRMFAKKMFHLRRWRYGLVALRAWLAARRLAWLVALRAWLGDLVDAEHLEQLKHLKHLLCSDLDQKRAIFWSKSEMKHLKHPKHLKHQS